MYVCEPPARARVAIVSLCRRASVRAFVRHYVDNCGSTMCVCVFVLCEQYATNASFESQPQTHSRSRNCELRHFRRYPNLASLEGAQHVASWLTRIFMCI